jgi:hypothetical protein
MNPFKINQMLDNEGLSRSQANYLIFGWFSILLVFIFGIVLLNKKKFQKKQSY